MCWNQYLTVKIAEEGLTEHLLCMQAKCKVSVTDEIVMDIVNDASVKMKYQYFMTKNFVQVWHRTHLFLFAHLVHMDEMMVALISHRPIKRFAGARRQIVISLSKS